MSDAASDSGATDDAAVDAFVANDATPDSASDASADTGVDANVDSGTGTTLCPPTVASPSPLCGSASSCDVVRDVTFTCSESGFIPTVAARGEGAIVGFTTNVGRFTRRAIAIAGDGSSTSLTVPFDDGPGITVGHYGGTDYLAVNEVPGRGIVFTAAGGTLEDVSGDADDFYQLQTKPMFTSDGRAWLIWGTGSSFSLSTRATSGVWSVERTVSTVWGRFGLDTEGTRVVYANWVNTDEGRQLVRHEVGSASSVLYADESSLDDGSPIAVDLGSDADLLAFRSGDIQLMTSVTPYAIANTAVAVPTGCPDLSWGPSGGGGDACIEPVACTETGEGSFQNAYDLVGEGDTHYLVYVEQHVDSDYSLTRRCGGPGCICVKTREARRDTATLVVRTVGTAGTVVTTSPFGRFELGDSGDDVQLDAAFGADGRLHIALFSTPPDGLETTLRYVALATR